SKAEVKADDSENAAHAATGRQITLNLPAGDVPALMSFLASKEPSGVQQIGVTGLAKTLMRGNRMQGAASTTQPARDGKAAGEAAAPRAWALPHNAPAATASPAPAPAARASAQAAAPSGSSGGVGGAAPSSSGFAMSSGSGGSGGGG